MQLIAIVTLLILAACALSVDAQTCRLSQIGTTSGSSGLGVSYSWSDGRQATRYVVTRAGISFEYPGTTRAHSEISGCGFGAHFTVRGDYSDGSTCTIQSSGGTAPHSAPCTASNALYSSIALNAASNSDLLAPGAIVAIYGDGLTSYAESATALPLPERLANIEVYAFKNTSREKRLQLFYASPTQVNALLPDDMPSGGIGTLAVINVAGDYLRPTWFYVNRSQPGVFTRSANGIGPAAGYWVGDTLVLFGTGTKDFSNVRLVIGNQSFPANWAGQAPGFIGLNQFNLPLPAGYRGAYGVLCAGLCSQNFAVP